MKKYHCKDCDYKGTTACPVTYWSPTASEYSEVCEKFHRRLEEWERHSIPIFIEKPIEEKPKNKLKFYYNYFLLSLVKYGIISVKIANKLKITN